MQPFINITTLNLHVYQREPALIGLGAALSAISPAAPGNCDIPDIGQVWPGQGGINGGFEPARGDVPEHYLIFAAEDAGSHEWGGRGIESAATSKTDGLANSRALAESDADYPAAQAAGEYTADGHGDFYLPSAAELYQAWVNCPEAFAKEWYWSSTQRSANGAFSQTFDDGCQGSIGKDCGFRVRPVRRLFI